MCQSVAVSHILDWSPLSARLKVERADKHIRDLNRIVDSLSDFDSYSVSVKVQGRKNYLHFVIDENKARGDASLTLGDSIHNLRSALDIVLRQTIVRFGGTPYNYTKFPIYEDREKLINAIDGGLKKYAAPEICALILDYAKPYKTRNYPIWAIHDLDIADKHQFIIPVFALRAYWGICLENDEHIPFKLNCPFFMDATCLVPIEQEGNLTIKDKGHAAANIIFPPGVPFEGMPVIPKLNELRQAVSGVVEAFECL